MPDKPQRRARVKLLHTGSLADTLDSVGEALFFGRKIPASERRRVARWIAGRHALPMSYAGMFAPTKRDLAQGIRLFTGERISSGAATRHILGEEASRTLLLLDVDTAHVRQSLIEATRSMDARLSESEAESRRPGFY